MVISSALCRVFPKPDSLLDLLLGMLVLDPTKRITAGAALQHEWFRQVKRIVGIVCAAVCMVPAGDRLVGIVWV